MIELKPSFIVASVHLDGVFSSLTIARASKLANFQFVTNVKLDNL
jgi:hypothetical protein